MSCEWTTNPASGNLAFSNRAINRAKARFPRTIVVDRMDLACSWQRRECLAIDDRLNKSFYDYGHNTLAGAALAGRRVDETGWLTTELARVAQR